MALFDSGIDGPVPVGVQNNDWSALTERLIRLDFGFVYDLADVPQDGAIAMCTDGEHGNRYDLAGAPTIATRSLLANVYPTCRALVWLRSAGDGLSLADASKEIVPSIEGVLLLGEFPRTAIAALHDEGRLLRAWLHHDLDPSRFGFFRFSAFPVDDQLSIGHPLPESALFRYFRTGRPRRPVSFTSLPTDLRDEVRMLEISGVSFQTAEEIDVCAVFDCWGWASGGPVELKRFRR
jgi:hypothetical protein